MESSESPENKENCQLLCSMEDQELVEAFKKVVQKSLARNYDVTLRSIDGQFLYSTSNYKIPIAGEWKNVTESEVGEIVALRLQKIYRWTDDLFLQFDFHFPSPLTRFGNQVY